MWLLLRLSKVVAPHFSIIDIYFIFNMLLNLKLEQVERQDVSYIELVKEGKSSFGVTFVDATGDQKGLVIKNVKPNSLAERCHALSEGDILFSLNGHDVTGIRCKNINRKIKEIGPKVEFELQYRIRETCICRSGGVYRKNIVTTTLKKVGSSFGFIIRKRNFTESFAAEFPVISNIKKGGPADKKSVMQDGDRLLMIDEINLSWLTLAEVAVILMEKAEAKFTFEYNIREVDLHQSPDKIITLDIDIPTRNLGIGFHCQWNDPGTVRISNIYLCSLAERCGLFSLGDIILSINDVSIIEYMALSKTKSQFQCEDQIRKLSFISTRSDYKDTCSIITGNSFNVPGLENIHFNTSANTNSPMSVPRKIQTKETFRREQVKAIKMFCDMLKYMTDLKQNLSKLTRKAFEGNSMLGNNEDCTVCNKTQSSVEMCASCISKVNVNCTKSMDLLRNIVSHFVKISLKQENCLPLNNEDRTKNARNHIKGPALENLMHSLTETLPKVFDGNLELQGSFQTLAHKISRAGGSCNSCKTEIDFASLTVQRLLLLIYLGNPTAEINALINQLVHCLLETKLTCEEFTESSDSSYENSLTESENASQPWQLPFADEESTLEMENDQRNRSEPEEIFSNSDQNVCDSISETLCLRASLIQRSNYFKLIDIPSCSQSDISTANEQKEAVGINIGLPQREPLVGSSEISVSSTLELNLLENSKKSNNSSESTKCCKNIIYKDKGLLNIPAKICRSAESVLSPHNFPQVQSAARNEFQNNSQQCNTKSSNEISNECSFTYPPQGSTVLEANYINRTNERNGSESNHESMEESSKDQTENEKSHVETMQVNLLNKGEGFGFVFGFISTNFSDTLTVPVIKQVKTNSPAHRSGVLAVNDRVLAINSKNMVDVPFNDLENMKRLVSKSKHITLTIEFDVMDTPMKFGTFDVVLVKTLKIGLLFEDMEKGSPMIVSGVMKGSASHRSGKLFPGDKVTLLKCFRNEEFDPISYNYNRREFVKITVIRDSSTQGIRVSPIPTNPFLCSPGSNMQKGQNFIVKRTSIHSVEHSDVLLLDQEITLYRDPVTWDFGFLVGENPNTGRAYITDIRARGPAGSSGVMKKFDRLVEVNGVAVGKHEACSVLSLLTQTNDKVDLLIRRVYHEDMKVASLKLPNSFL